MTTRAGDTISARGTRVQRRPAARGGIAAARRERAAKLERGLLWALALGQRGIVVALALAVLVAFAAGIFEQRWKEQQLRAQVAAQEATLQATEAQNAKLRAQLAANDPNGYRAWVEATARRQLNLGYAGETIFLVNWQAAPTPATTATAANNAPAQQTTAPAAPPAEAHWRKWLRLLIGE